MGRKVELTSYEAYLVCELIRKARKEVEDELATPYLRPEDAIQLMTFKRKFAEIQDKIAPEATLG